MKQILLLSRIFEESQASAARLRCRGWSVYRAPMLHLRAIATPDLCERLSRAKAIALTSKSALRVLPASLFSRYEINRLRVYAVGEETAALARRKGFRDIRTADSNVDRLYELIEQNLCKDHSKNGSNDDSIVHLCGKHIRGNLVAKLHKNGYSAESIIIYEAVSARNLPISVERMFKRNQVYASIIYSARSADIFARLYARQVQHGRNGRSGSKDSDEALRFFCLSPRIGERVAQHFPTALIASAKEPNEKSLLQTIDNYSSQYG